jgi:exonuclease SbcD
LLHVSDWHVGLTTGPFPRRPDHEVVFEEIKAAVREYKPDLLLHTGDVFHVGSPAVDDLRFGIDALQKLAALVPVIALRGNHDSDRLFRVFTLLLGSEAGLKFVASPPHLASSDAIMRVPSADGRHAIALAALPFIHANRFIKTYIDAPTQTVTFADHLGKYERTLGDLLLRDLDPSTEVAIFAAHQFVQGAHKSGSERAIHVGEEYATRSNDIPAVSYAAFGHIHEPQSIGSGSPARYAGSPIQIDYGEQGQQKSIVFVEALPRKSARVETVPLSGGRQLLTVSTKLADLSALRGKCAGKLCKITVLTEKPVSDLSKLVQDAMPEADIVDVIEDCPATRAVAVEDKRNSNAEQSLAELFADFLATNPLRDAESARVRKAFEVILAATEGGEEPSLAQLGVSDPELLAGGLQ